MKKLLFLGLLLASASVQAQDSSGVVVNTTATDSRTAVITFVNGHVSEITYDKLMPTYTYTYSVGDQYSNASVTIGGNMPNITFDNMKLIRLGYTKPQVQGIVGQPGKITRTINADGVTDAWFYGDSIK
jgi:hypothetical protein